METFRIDVPDSDLSDLRERIGRTRWPNSSPAEPWVQGTPLAYLRELCDYWVDGYDWRSAEARINSYEQLVTEVEGQRIHLLHVISPPGRASAGAFPRLARVDRRIPRHDRTLGEPPRPLRRLQPGHPLAARLRVLWPHLAARMESPAHRRRIRSRDGEARLHPLRGPGRGLGLDGVGQHGGSLPRSGGGPAPQLHERSTPPRRVGSGARAGQEVPRRPAAGTSRSREPSLRPSATSSTTRRLGFAAG